MMRTRVLRTAWLMAAVWLALPLWSFLPSHHVPVLFRVLVAVLLVLATARPVAGLTVLAGLGPMVVPLVVASGPPLFGGNGALEAMVIAVLAGIALRWSVTGPLPDGRLGRPSFLFIALVASSALTLIGTQHLTNGSVPSLLEAAFQHAIGDYFFEPGRFPAWHEAAVWIDAILLALMIERVVRSAPGSGRVLARIAALGLLGEAVFSWLRLWQVAARSEDFVSGLWRHALSTRMSPHFPDLNAIGSLFALGTVCWLALMLGTNRRRWAQAGMALGAVVMGGALWLTGSRAALGATGVAALVLWRQAYRPALRTVILVAALAVAVGNALLTFSQGGRDRAPIGSALGIRIDLARVGILMAADHPLFGAGIGEFSHQSTEYISADLVARFPAAATGENAHNQLIQVLGELGFAGLLVFIWYWSRVLWPAIASLRDGEAGGWLLAWTAGLCAFHASAMLGHPFLTPYVVFCVFLITGVVAGLTPGGPEPQGRVSKAGPLRSRIAFLRS